MNKKNLLIAFVLGIVISSSVSPTFAKASQDWIVEISQSEGVKATLKNYNFTWHNATITLVITPILPTLYCGPGGQKRIKVPMRNFRALPNRTNVDPNDFDFDIDITWCDGTKVSKRGEIIKPLPNSKTYTHDADKVVVNVTTTPSKLGGPGSKNAQLKSVNAAGILIDRTDLLVPYIGLASTIIVTTAATAIYVKRAKHRKKKQ